MEARKKIVYSAEPPAGLFYLPQFLTAQEEHDLLISVSTQPFAPYDHHGYKANREVVYYGTPGGYSAVAAEEHVEPIPDWLVSINQRLANLLELEPGELSTALVARYAIGAGIGWHRDRPQYGPSVFGLSLASDAEMRFRRFVGEHEEMYKINLERRSAYIIGGPARSVWQHGMNPVKQLRYSITFRTLKQYRNIDLRHSPDRIAKRLINLQLYCDPAAKQSLPANQLKLPL